MSSALAQAHIAAEKRLRDVVSAAIAGIWRDLPGYDRENVDEWLSKAVPVAIAGQRQSVAITEAFLARSLGRRPLGINPAEIVGPGIRAGADPAEVYERPFVTLWAALGAGVDFDTGAAGALARATSTAATDVQLAMRATANAVQQADDAIFGYQRVADGGACAFCLEIDGAYVKSADAFPLHNHCGCGLEPLTAPRGASEIPPTVAVHEHGELGAVLADPTHDFTGKGDL